MSLLFPYAFWLIQSKLAMKSLSVYKAELLTNANLWHQKDPVGSESWLCQTEAGT